MPGIIAIVTGDDLVRAGVKPLPLSADFRRSDGSPTASAPRHALAVGTVRFVGEAVAAVIASDLAQARDAVEAIDVRYAPLPSVVDSAEAVAPGAPLVWPAASGNVACEARHGDAVATEAAFRRARHVVTLDIVNQRLAPNPIEPRAILASYDAVADRITLRVSNQTPTGLRDALCAEVLGIPKDKVRVQVGDVGGGFGMKTGLYPEDVVLAHCARALRPAGQVVCGADGGIPGRFAWARRAQQGRIGARREWARSRAARRLAGQRGRVRNTGRCRDPVADRSLGVDQHLRHRHDRPSDQGRDDPYHRRRAPIAARAVRRRSISSSSLWTRPRARPASTPPTCAGAT